MSGYRKGYGRSKLSRKELLKRKPDATFVRGVFGRVPNLYQILDDALRERGWNWSTLADAAGYTRTHVVKVTEQQSIPYDTLVRLCTPLDLDADQLIEDLETREATG